MDVNTMYNTLMNQVSSNNAWSAEQAQKQMDFQREMSNTAHQREMADLKAAGLNPILSAQQGASTPNGAMGQTDTTGTTAMASLMSKMLDVQALNAQAMMHGYGSEYGYGSGSYDSDGNLLTDPSFWTLILETAGFRPSDAEKIAKNLGYLQDKYSGLFDNIVSKVEGWVDKIGSTAKAVSNRYANGEDIVSPIYDAIFGQGTSEKLERNIQEKQKAVKDFFITASGNAHLDNPDNTIKEYSGYYENDKVNPWQQQKNIEEIKRKIADSHTATFKTSGISKYVLPYVNKNAGNGIKQYGYNVKQQLFKLKSGQAKNKLGTYGKIK